MDNAHKLMTKTGNATLQRPRYSPGLLLEDDDLNSGVNYTRDLTRLLFKSLFGCGVICGLKVTAKPICKGSKLEITVAKGIALDSLGNPLEVPSPLTLEYDPQCKDFPPVIWVTLCYTEKCCRPKDVSCSAEDDSQPKPTRVRAGYEVNLYDVAPECACRCGKDDPAPVGRERCRDVDAAEPAPVAAAIAVSDAGQADDPCPCYSSHFKGECDCGCSCVLIAKIMPLDVPDKDPAGRAIAPEDREATVDTSVVRRIRPVLNGYLDCRFPPQKPGGDPVLVRANKPEEPAADARNQ